MPLIVKIVLSYILLIIFLIATHHHLKKQQRRRVEAELQAIQNWFEVKRKAKKILEKMEAQPFGTQPQD